MKKRLISVSVAAALGSIAGSAVAQNPASVRVYDPTGVGHALIVPYFSTQGGNATLIDIVNTDLTNGKAVKIRFRGASNSDDIFDFQVLMSPGDVWSAAVTKNAANGLSHLSTTDHSCTVPSILRTTAAGFDFVTARLNPKLTGDALAAETREGYVEIFNMGDIYPDTSTTGNLYLTTKHVSGVATCDATITDSLTINDSRLTRPTSGLMGNWTIINVPQTTTWTGDMAALEARDGGGVAGFGNLVYWPQQAISLTALQITNGTADPLFRKGVVAGAQYDLPDLSTPYLPLGPVTPQQNANDLSQALAVQTAAGEFLTNPAISGSTDWVVSLPTRRYYVAVDYSGTNAALVDNRNDNSDVNAVYFRKKGATLTNGNVSLTGYQGCIALAAVGFRDQEETPTAPGGPVFSPATPAPAPSLCGEVSVLSINGVTVPTGSVTNSANTTPASTALKSTVARGNIGLPFTDGWGFVNQPNNGGTSPVTALGIPMVTQEFVRAVNGAASAGVSGTYAARWDARTLLHGAPYAGVSVSP